MTEAGPHQASSHGEMETSSREITIALAGNPNSGKTTVFNALTGSRQHVGNWPGVTVEHKEGTIEKNGYRINVVDLPGIYSLSAYSQEEIVARDYLLNNKVDVIINIVDAANLERNLYLTTQILELGIDTVVALNMFDAARESGIEIDIDAFASRLGSAVVPTVASRGEGMDKLIEAAIGLHMCRDCDKPRSTRHGSEIEDHISSISSRLTVRCESNVPIRWVVVKALEGDEKARRQLATCTEQGAEALQIVDNTRRHLESVYGDDLEAVIADDRYGFVGGLIREVVTRKLKVPERTGTDKVDSMVLNRWLGIPIFLAIMFVTFKLTFDVGSLLSSQIDTGIGQLVGLVSGVLPAGPVSSILTDGIIPGVGQVLVFLPNIAIMFLIISLLEDSGYMARAAFLMDRSMHILGLHGKSFIPMLMGFGCNVPAIMATRTLESKADRIITILINPFMSCTARLPIYILFAGTFFPKNGALVIFLLYALGVVVAVIYAKIFRRIFFAKSESPFVMELPSYRTPTVKGTLIHVWERSWAFIAKAGTIILAASVIVWALGTFPTGGEFAGESSYIGIIGKSIEPLTRPLGIPWQGAVALVSGIGAKEIVVSTLAVISGSTEEGLARQIPNLFNPISGLAFLVVSLLYMPCLATVAAIKRETNSWKWTLFSVGYSLATAYGLGLAVYQIGRFFSG